MSQLLGMDRIISSLTGNYDTQMNKTTENTTNTIGNPTLSENASSYYEELKSKYEDVEFVLVSEDQKSNAKELASNISSNKSMIVLISEDEVEQMAADEDVRTKNEQLIADAKTQMPDILEQLQETGASVKSFGMEFDDNGTASYFAVIDKSMAAQKERIETNLAEKRAEKKADATETDSNSNKVTELRKGKKEDLTTVSASSIEELMKKIQTTFYESRADYLRTEQEKMVGQSFDFTI